MSGFSSLALPGRIPVAGPGKDMITPETLFKNQEERESYRRIIGLGGSPKAGIKIKKVKVETFDMSDPKQVRKYERLWKELLEKTARMEVAVEARKDLVNRKDGTSYWMKYVEYVEFGPSDEGEAKENGEK